MIITIRQEERQKAKGISYVNSKLSISFASTCISWQPENISEYYQLLAETGNLNLITKELFWNTQMFIILLWEMLCKFKDNHFFAFCILILNIVTITMLCKCYKISCNKNIVYFYSLLTHWYGASHVAKEMHQYVTLLQIKCEDLSLNP